MSSALSYILQALAVLGGLALLLMAWQHYRYLRIRREAAQDRQSLLHHRDAFHVITFFRVPEGERVADSARAFYNRLQDSGSPRLVYAGHSGFKVESKQLGAQRWDGLVLLEYSSRSVYENEASKLMAATARDLFSDSYRHGMRRNRRDSLALPLALLAIRVQDIFMGRWRPLPLDPQPGFDTAPEYDVWRQRIERLEALHRINPRGLVVFNLVKHGTEEQRRADSAYTRRMLSRMAALGHGPLHMGRSVALEGSARFDHVAIVLYPSAHYFAELISSQFFQSIIGDKQLADTQAVPTVPLTEVVA